MARPDVPAVRALHSVGQADPVQLLNTFLDVSLSLTQQFDIQHILISIVERSMSLTSARYGAVVLVGPDGKLIDFLHRGLTQEEARSMGSLPEGHGLLGEVLGTRAALRIDKMSEHPKSIGFPQRHVEMEALLGVPMMFRDQLVGAVYLTKPPGDSPFDPTDEALMKALAAMAALGVENARLFHAESRLARRNLVLHSVSEAVHASLDLNTVLSSAAEQLGKAARVDRCVIRLARSDSGELEDVPHQWHVSDLSPLAPGHTHLYPVAMLTASTRTTQWSDDIAADDRPTLDVPELPGGRAALATPLIRKDSLIGVAVLHSRNPRAWTTEDIMLIEDAAATVAAGIHHVRAIQDAVEAARRFEELDTRRSDYVTMVAHEVRSPVTAIAGIAQQLRARDDIEQGRRNELLDTLVRESARLARLVSTILDIERDDQGALELDMTKVDIAQLTREAIADANAVAKTRVVVEPGIAEITADRDKIKQVMINLLNNACRYSPPDDPVTVTVTPGDADVTLTVSDRGPGIPPEHHDKLFTRFGTVPGDPRQQGSGLGLYLSRRLVEAHGGRIWLDTSPESTTFSVRLPRKSF